MAEWMPPKTNWLVEDVPGTGDFERIEGNIEHLKDNCSHLPAMPGNDYVLTADTVRSVGGIGGLPGGSVIKEFQLPRWGEYKLSYRLTTSLQGINDLARVEVRVVEASGETKTVYAEAYGRIINENIVNFVTAMSAGAKIQIILFTPSGQSSNTITISHARVSYSISTSEVKPALVLKN